MSLLDYNALQTTPLKREPYEYLVVPHFIRKNSFMDVFSDFPAIEQSGSFPLEQLNIQGQFATLLDELRSIRFRRLIEKKFGLNLTDCGRMITVRGQCSKRDGKIHTDSKNKLITALLYVNRRWEAQGGRLHILQNNTSLDSTVDNVSPDNGTLLVMRRSEKSWHGHAPFVGTRRMIQLNWFTDTPTANFQYKRHRLSAWMKQLFHFPRLS